MEVSLAAIVSIIVGFFGILALVAWAWVVVRAKLVTTAAENWQQTAESLEARLNEHVRLSDAKIRTLNEKLLKQEADHKLAEAECRSRITALETANAVLQDTVSGTAAILDLKEELIPRIDSLELAIREHRG